MIEVGKEIQMAKSDILEGNNNIHIIGKALSNDTHLVYCEVLLDGIKRKRLGENVASAFGPKDGGYGLSEWAL